MRVSLSDLLLFEPYGQLPATLDEVIPHTMPTLTVRSSKKLGFYWEAYGTNPARRDDGDQRDGGAGGHGRADACAASEARAPRVEGGEAGERAGAGRVGPRQTMSPRSVEVDISTLPPGPYLVELEIEVAKQYHVRTERRIVVE